MAEQGSFGKVVDWLASVTVINPSGSGVASTRDSLSVGTPTEESAQNGQDVEPVHDGECAQS